LIGGLIGFWQSRSLIESAASGALRSISKGRNQRPLERNPIDYA
jgi:hypothetical protein